MDPLRPFVKCDKLAGFLPEVAVAYYLCNIDTNNFHYNLIP